MVNVYREVTWCRSYSVRQGAIKSRIKQLNLSGILRKKWTRSLKVRHSSNGNVIGSQKTASTRVKWKEGKKGSKPCGASAPSALFPSTRLLDPWPAYGSFPLLRKFGCVVLNLAVWQCGRWQWQSQWQRARCYFVTLRGDNYRTGRPIHAQYVKPK